jgi:glycosyltransferase involved in cell wall biosynthesis
VRLALALKDNFAFQKIENLKHLGGASLLAEYLRANKVSHVHVHFAFGAASIAIFLNALTGIPYSLTIHGSDVLLPHPLTEEKLKRAKFIISNCRFHINNLRRRFLSLVRQQFYIIRIGLDLHSGAWSLVNPPENDPVFRILNVARLEAVKAQDVLIKACSALRDKGVDFQCRIVGEGPKREELNGLIEDLALREYVELVGSCYESEVINLYEWSHVVVLSSLSEGTPMTIIEAMAKARPVIVPRITALPEMIIDGKTGYFFEPGSVEDLTDKLVELALHPMLMSTMGDAGCQRAKKLFDLNANIQNLMDVLADEVPSLGWKRKANPS